MSRPAAACLAPGYCGLCQIRGEQAAADRAAYREHQQEIAKALHRPDPGIHQGRSIHPDSHPSRALAALVALGGRASTPQIRRAVNAAGRPALDAGQVHTALVALAGRRPVAAARQAEPGDHGHGGVWELAGETEAEAG